MFRFTRSPNVADRTFGFYYTLTSGFCTPCYQRPRPKMKTRSATMARMIRIVHSMDSLWASLARIELATSCSGGRRSIR